MSNLRCFISYSWDHQKHKDWVRLLAEELRKNGVDAKLDQWDCQLGMDLANYMETGIRESDFVLLICIPIFCEKANSGTGGVGYEKCIVTGEIFQGTDPRKFIPILREGTPKESMPSYLKSKVYIDFRNDGEFDSNLEDLLRPIYKSPKYVRPPLGFKPPFSNDSQQSGISGKKVKIWDFRTYRLVYDYAISYFGMKLLPEQAREFADEWMFKHSDRNFEDYKQVYEYAVSFIGMKLLPSAARLFADKWMTEYADRNFDGYKQVYEYAVGYFGMKLLPEQAREFADEWMFKYSKTDFGNLKQIYEYAVSSIGMKLLPSDAKEFALEKIKEQI